MRYSQAEKIEIIRMVEGSSLSVKQTFAELAINRKFKDAAKIEIDKIDK